MVRAPKFSFFDSQKQDQRRMGAVLASEIVWGLYQMTQKSQTETLSQNFGKDAISLGMFLDSIIPKLSDKGR